MITFTKEKIHEMSQEEQNMLNDLAQRYHVAIQEEETERVKAHIKEHFEREKENENYSKWVESQFDTNGGKATTQFM